MRVLRLRPGDNICITNGNGSLWEARIAETGNTCSLEVYSYSLVPEEPEIHLAVGILQSSDRMEWMVEKLTELGATRISLLSLQRCERKKVNTDRLRTVAIAALKQSGRARLPEISGPVGFDQYLQSNLPDLRFAGYLPAEDAPDLSSCVSTPAPCTILIGPEGDLTPEEYRTAADQGFQAVRLGASVLRTETAAMAACCLLRLGIRP